MRGGGGRQGQIARRHISVGAQVPPPLAPAHVDCDGQQQHEADRHRRCTALEAEPDEPIGQERDDDRPDQRLADRTASAANAVAAEQRRCERREFEADPGVGPTPRRAVRRRASPASAASTPETT